MAHRNPLALASMVPITNSKGRPFGARRGLVERGRHHPEIIGDIFLEGERLEIRMMGEIISEQAGDIERNPHSGSRFEFEQTNSCR